MKLKEKIAAHEQQCIAMSSMLMGEPGWGQAARKLDRLERQFLDHVCTTQTQFNAWTRHARAIPSINKRITELLPEKARQVREAVLARKPVPGRTFDNPQTTYEFGILGSDRIPVVEPRPGSKTKYHRKYPLEVMEIGEQLLVPGMKDRTGMAGTLAAAQRRYRRRFSTTSTDAGLLVRRIE